MVDISAVGGSLAGGFAQGINEGIRNISAVQGIRQNQEQMEMTREKMGMEKEQNALAQITTRQQQALHNIELDKKKREEKVLMTPVPISSEIQNSPERLAFLKSYVFQFPEFQSHVKDVGGITFASPFVQNKIQEIRKSDLEFAKTDNAYKLMDLGKQMAVLNQQLSEVTANGINPQDKKYINLQAQIKQKQDQISNAMYVDEGFAKVLAVEKLKVAGKATPNNQDEIMIELQKLPEGDPRRVQLQNTWDAIQKGKEGLKTAATQLKIDNPTSTQNSFKIGGTAERIAAKVASGESLTEPEKKAWDMLKNTEKSLATEAITILNKDDTFQIAPPEKKAQMITTTMNNLATAQGIERQRAEKPPNAKAGSPASPLKLDQYKQSVDQALQAGKNDVEIKTVVQQQINKKQLTREEGQELLLYLQGKRKK